MRHHSIAVLSFCAAVALLSAPAFAATTTIVSVSGLTFISDDITIEEGDSVMWTGLQNGVGHNVAEVDESDWNANNNAYNGGFRSGVAGAVSSFLETFNAPGTFYYICQPHIASGMKGKITVNAAPPPPPIPLLSPWGMITLVVLLAGASAFVLHRRKPLGA